MNSIFFKRELDLIVDEDLRMAVKCFFDERVPKYFWEIGASASGNIGQLGIMIWHIIERNPGCQVKKFCPKITSGFD